MPVPTIRYAARMPAPAASLVTALASLEPSVRTRLERAGFDRDRFLALAASLTEGDPVTRRTTRNTVKGEVTPPRPGEILAIPPVGSPEHARCLARGEEALRKGEVAFCTMAGGMATRMGGIVKALAKVWDDHSFLSLRVAENRAASERAGRPVPLWLMTSEATHVALKQALRDMNAPPHVRLFMQDLSLRLNPDGTLFVGDDGQPSIHATGHGDLVDALRRSKLLDEFLADGGKAVWITNVDNLGATLDPVLLGLFLETGSGGRGAGSPGIDVLSEVCDKGGDKGGIPVHAEGKLQVLEEFRLPAGFDPSSVDVFNVNTFLVRAEPLAKTPLTWTFFEVEKKVDGRTAIQFERLIQEITAQMSTAYVKIPREGATSRFLPVKDYDELARRRATIEVVARARGMV